ncbi:MAG: hypothetical protein PGN23_05600 [Sphingomonas adhaesiva]|uniref:hypothetical protein n=1 Tax=Sphingomonas adhaesiva TaxID=28212 RepID=UPI002FF4D3DC
MAAMYRMKGLGWLASCALVAIGFYLVSSQVAAERKRLDRVDRDIVRAQRDIRALETEFDVRANLAQLERWNGDTLALSVPTAAQFVADEARLASLSPRQIGPAATGAGTVQTAQLIVPAHNPAAAPITTVAATTTTAAPAAGVVKVAAVKPATAAPVRLTPAVATAAAVQPRAIKAVAMLDKSLLSDSTIGDLLSGARQERNRLR